ncbi:sigma-70 family RNA polymerase sigma factor [Steroidobacter sp. S1-65]|uniref:Sigma-70 family RNA polymerase sigma factor n=2 Tax=Steroidobacter gossypii TaxID=2805490 RepID=A0ABS1X0S4_9GAMM|nr:sigma-70 family RNA polymerase sigma factor [Steroidobacter gossypii]
MSLAQLFMDRASGGRPSREVDWDAAYRDQLPRVYNYLRFRLGSDADAEELTSRTFEKAWRSRTLYRRDLAGFSTWLFTIAQNLAIDHLRAHRPHLPLEAALEVVSAESPHDQAERDSNLARLAVLMERLSPRDREVVALKYGADLSNRDIARLTGLSESNVGTLLHRAVRELRSGWESPEKP